MTFSLKNQLCIGLSLNHRQKKQAAMDQAVSAQIGQAQRAEQAKLDFVFKPDSLYAHPARLSSQAGLDPTLVLTLIAEQTDNIGLVTTISASFQPPYILARQLQTLHWISNGRAGWNIVTSLDGGENFGETSKLSSECRYEKARECTEVVQKLWRSFPAEALTARNPQDLVKPITHQGNYFQVKGPLSIAMHASGEPVLFQAGASEAGRQFAASVASAIFAATPDKETAKELRQDLRNCAKANQRSPSDIRVLPGLYFFLGDSYEEAQQMHREAHQHLTLEHRYASIETTIGLDVRELPLDTQVTEVMLPSEKQPVRNRTHANLLRRFISDNQPTVKRLLDRPEVIDSAHWVEVGTPQQVLGRIIEWYNDGAMDGFIAIPGGTEKSLNLFFDQLVPLLTEAGVFRREYTSKTLRDHLK
ncbi:NtaA/DmoA family FMN-dependent monooxygenase [Gracilibacillus phocaeensis]|uniref:NtaA/DmoA family FMN-dependent monooxygenase n=1 Tax=Gracilibacillus phocaeensis TaxID=2042304 RepID=UPI00256FB921|nr:NtaA/DmoA family FMN-dependent monooxygenase [Gracilibacillus phocaeensis]